MLLSLSSEQNGFSHECPCIVIIDGHGLTRSCLAWILRADLREFTILEIEDARHIDSIIGRPVGLVALNIGSCAITAESVLESLTCLHRSLPGWPILLLTQLEEEAITDAMVSEITRYGVRGYVADSASIEILLASIRLLVAGGMYFPRSVPEVRSDPISVPFENIVEVEPAHMDPIEMPCMTGFAFTERELQVLATLRRGASNKVIAHQLNMSQNTVKVHVSNIMRKLRATNRTEAVLAVQQKTPLFGC